MALTVEDGTGLSVADSYVALTYADAYAEARAWADWEAAGDDEKESALRQAAVYIDTIARYKGVRLKADQEREFPRSGLTDWSSYPVTGLPKRVRDAAVELARKALTESLYVDLDRGGQVASESVGPVSVSYFNGAPVGKMFRAAMQLLEPYVRDKSALYVSGAPASASGENFALGMHDGSDT